jgi:hypothetical protein
MNRKAVVTFLRAEGARIDRTLSEAADILALAKSRPTAEPKKPRHKMSAKGRRAISIAQKNRWKLYEGKKKAA